MPFLLFLFLFIPLPVLSESPWFNRHSEGWFWYESLQESEPEDESPTSDKATSSQPLSVAWIRQNIGHYLDKAIDEPSKENVSAYLYLDRLVKEKSERFA